MTRPGDLDRPGTPPAAHPADGALGEAVAPHRAAAGPEPQWAEAYQLFDGEYLSLDDLLRTLAD